MGMTILVLAAWFGYRLSEGPLSLDFLTPYIEDALTIPDGGLAVKLERTVLVWSQDSRTVQIRVDGVRALSADGGVIAAIPEMSLSLSARALLHGVVAPRSLRLFHPSIRLLRDSRGKLQFGLGEAAGTATAAPALGEALQALLTAPGGDTAAGQLQRIEVFGADLVIDDETLGKHWHAPRADLRFLRDQRGISGHGRIDLDVEGEVSRLDADGVYEIGQQSVDATLAFSGIRPSLFAELAPQLQPLSALQLLVGGTVSLHYGLNAGLTDIHFDMAGGQGTIDASIQLGTSWPVQSVLLRGALTHGLATIDLDEFRLDLGGPVVSLAGKAEQVADGFRIDATARVGDVPIDELKGLWPPALAPHPRAWILANLSQGRVRSATAKLTAHLPAGQSWDGLVIDGLGGEVVSEGVTVQYLAPMPAVTNVSGVAHFDPESFVIDVKSGEVLGLGLQEGRIVLGGLSRPLQYADIKLKIGGPVAAALRLIDSKPLGWATKLGVQPAKVSGDAVTQLDLRFPLLENLVLDQLNVHAHAVTSHLAIGAVALGLDLSEGALSLDVDPKGMDVAGTARLGGAPAAIHWQENFAKAAFRSRYQVSAVADDDLRKAVGLDTAPFQAPFLSGPVPIELTATLAEAGKGEIDIKADLGTASMALPGLNWRKAAGTAAQAQANLRLAGDRLVEVPSFTVSSANGLDIEGEVGFEAGQARRVTLRRAKWARTDVKLALALHPGKTGLALVLDVSGPSFDARELVADEPSDGGTDRAPLHPNRAVRHERPAQREDLVPLLVQGKFGQVWLSDDGTAHNVSASLVRDKRDWQQARVDGVVGEDGKPLHIEIQPQGNNHRAFHLTSSDAGAVFRCFNVFENVMGGQLTVDGVYDDADPHQPLTGLATVTDYQVVKAPALARLLTVASLTGILDLLAGDGIPFSNLEAPFTLTEGVLDLHDARAYGTALGITAKGQMDFDTDEMALEGTVVPIYVLNSVLGNVPLVGSLFSAEKGGGILAMNYSMKGPGDNPTVIVNPLSALTPGFLRKLFDIFDTGTETQVRPLIGPAKPKPVN